MEDVIKNIGNKKLQTSKRPSQPSLMEYPYAMIVFYKKHRNPHGPSSQPIMCVGIERANYAAAATLLQEFAAEFGELSNNGKGPLMVGVFSAERHMNLGTFDELLSRDSAREKFFEVIRSELNPDGEPILIGEIRSIYGHPETGWSELLYSQGKSGKGGCFGVLLVSSILIPVCCGLAYLML